MTFALLWLLALASSAPNSRAATPDRPTATQLSGIWAGTLEHDGDKQAVALGLLPGTSGKLGLTFSMPVVHLDRIPFEEVTPSIEGDTIGLGPFRLRYDRKGQTLSGFMPASLVPVYAIPIRLRRVERFDAPKRAVLSAPAPESVWTFSGGSPMWAGPTFADGRVYVGAEDGSIHAFDARSGASLWSYHTGGPIRARPVVSGSDLYVQADDGYLYKLSAGSGELRWRVPVAERPIERLPASDPKSRYDRFGADVVVAEGRLYVGTYGGKVLALNPADGARMWEFQAGDAVLAAPAVADGRVVFGSYDRHVYALSSATGALLWKRDTQGAVVSTPAVVGHRAVIGNRCYDLLGLDVRTGAVAWKRYVWMSWVESSPSVRNGVAYVGSSDAVAVYAVDVAKGRPRWTADVQGWSWGQPAVTERRVYVGTSSSVGYLPIHSGALAALDRGTGAVVWRFAPLPEARGPYGFPGSPAYGMGLVFASTLGGRLYAFKE